MDAKLFIIVLICSNFAFSNSNLSEKTCIKWDKSRGTRAFVDQLYRKYGKLGSNGLTRSMDSLGFNKLLRNLGIGSVLVQCQDDDDECIKDKLAFHGEGGGGGLGGGGGAAVAAAVASGYKSGRKRRAAAIEKSEAQKEEELRIAHERHWNNHVSNCFRSDAFLSLHAINSSDGISEKEFLRMCPSLIQQIDNNMCVHHHKKIEHDDHLPTSTEVWGYGVISITIISLLSLSVIAVIPCLKKSFYSKVMAFLVALAVGTLAGDAMLHLIPHAFVEGANSATNATMSEADELNQHYSQVWRALFVLLGLYIFFVVEQLMKLKVLCCKGDGHGHNHEHSPDSPVVPQKELFQSPNDDPKIAFANQGENTEPVTIPLEHSLSCTSDVHNDHSHSVNPDGHFHVDDRHHHHHHGEKNITKDTKIASVAWMVIVGDGFHNFSDGLAVGAAFSASISSGVSTAIAVFCHELPHELGDFAILIKSGMTVRQAIVYNLVSAVLAYFGLAIGIVAGSNELGRHFILSITAGMFLYISLADMLPELTHQDIPRASRCAAFICQHMGILTGIGIMLVISLYEHNM